MEILNKALLDKVKRKHNQLRKPIDAWMKVIYANSFYSLHDIKKVIPSCDLVGKRLDKYCFDLKSHRMITEIDFEDQEVDVLEVITHKQYDRDYSHGSKRKG